MADIDQLRGSTLHRWNGLPSASLRPTRPWPEPYFTMVVRSDSKQTHLTTPAHILSIAVFVGWLLKGGVVKVHYALCSVKRCSSKQKRTAKIGKIKDPAWDAFQFSGFGLNGVRKLSVLTCSHSVWYKVNLYFHMEISKKKKKTNGSSRTTPFFLLIPRCGSKQDL